MLNREIVNFVHKEVVKSLKLIGREYGDHDDGKFELQMFAMPIAKEAVADHNGVILDTAQFIPQEIIDDHNRFIFDTVQSMISNIDDEARGRSVLFCPLERLREGDKIASHAGAILRVTESWLWGEDCIRFDARVKFFAKAGRND